VYEISVVPTPIDTLLRANLRRLEQRIEVACAAAGRTRSQITVVAVTKGRSPESALAAYACGLHDLGENRVEELETKAPLLERALLPEAPVWHMIGHVQSRKADRVATAVTLIHSVDSLHLARRLDHYGQAVGRPVRVLVQVNVSGEEHKSGFAAATPEQQAQLVDALQELRTLQHLQVDGLMTIAPIVRDPEETRPVFRQTRLLGERLRAECPFSRWDMLSMGMSDDFQIAIQEGATLIRIGRALFEPSTSEREDTA
jgi:pyridoxal phosphate enzyme (YggS family)